MSKRCVLFAALALALITVSEAAAQPAKSSKKPRFFNPFLPRYSRLQVTPFGFPQFQTTGAGSTVLVNRPALSTPVTAAPAVAPAVAATTPAITSTTPVMTAPPVVTAPAIADAVPVTASPIAAAATAGVAAADLSETGDNIPQTVVSRPPFRPPVRSPYRPPPRPPF